MDRIAVVLLNYNTWEATLDIIKAVNEIYKITYEDFIVIDNASSNNSAFELEVVKKWGCGLIINEENSGYAIGNNIGLRHATEKGYDYAWILNNDIAFEDPKMLDKLLNVLKKDDSVATVNPDIYSQNGHMFNRDVYRPTFFDLTFGMGHYKKKGRNILLHDTYGYVYRPQGCCMLLDLNKVKSIDFFDEGTFLYSEEIILAERLRTGGYKSACCVDSKVIHNHSTTVKSAFAKRKIRKIQQKSFKYYLKNYRGYNYLMLAIASCFNYIKLLVLDARRQG